MSHYGTALLESILALCAVCLLAWITLRLGRGRLVGRRHARLVERTPLDPRTTLYIVEVGGKTLLLGSGGGSLSTLAELDPGALEVDEPAPSSLRFADVIRRVRGVSS